jgi:hypothetical protein
LSLIERRDLFKMGIIFGKTGSPEPSFQVLYQSSKYCIRKYDSMFVAEVIKSDAAFKELAKYIGVFGTPENVLDDQATSMAMTAPVLTYATYLPHILMTHQSPPSLPTTTPPSTPPNNTSTEVMAFILPSEYKSLESIPTPLNPDITIKQIPGRLIAVKSFTGLCPKVVCDAESGRFYRELVIDHASHFIATKEETPIGNSNTLDKIKWQIAQFHPPFTLPFLRRNEVWIDFDIQQEETLLHTLQQKEK